jgi:epoxyqueuosine reductase
MRALGGVGRAVNGPWSLRYGHRLPVLPWIRGRYRAPIGWWQVELPAVPPELQTVPGIWRNPLHEEEAYEAAPLHDWIHTHAGSVEWQRRRAWDIFLVVTPRLMKAAHACARTAHALVAPSVGHADPEALKRDVKAKAAELGMSTLGVAQYDPKFTFAEHAGCEAGDRMLVCVLEQNWEATQTIPSVRAEKAAMAAYSQLHMIMVDLAEYLHSRGYRARAFPLPGNFVSIHYGVEAGLGQLGMNGQLLTPAAGSRCRLAMISTNAPLPLDHPVDYGIHKICDECQVCVRRCPSGAIPKTRREHRGVIKSKLNTARCWPVVAQEEACGICMKVCPVQRYGLGPVLEEHARSGKILGKDLDELEGYDFHGRHYGPGERPQLPAEYFEPPGFEFDPKLKQPLETNGSTPFSV